MHRLKALLADRRWPRFLLVGGLCFLTNLGVLYVGTDGLGLHYLVSMAASVVIANTLGWALNRAYTFGSGSAPPLMEYMRYLSVNLGGFAASMLLMALLVSGFGVNYLLASALLAIGLTLVNFVLHRDWSFRERGDSEKP